MKMSETAPVDGSPPRKPALPVPYMSANVVTAPTTSHPDTNARTRWSRNAPLRGSITSLGSVGSAALG